VEHGRGWTRVSGETTGPVTGTAEVRTAKFSPSSIVEFGISRRSGRHRQQVQSGHYSMKSHGSHAGATKHSVTVTLVSAMP